MFKKILSAVLATGFIAAALGVAGCNTIQGAGKDVERAGEKVQQEAVEHKKY